MARIFNLFTAHPGSVGESFGAHFLFAMRFSAWLFVAAGAAFVHALMPFLFERTASRIIARLYRRTHGRGSAPLVSDD